MAVWGGSDPLKCQSVLPKFHPDSIHLNLSRRWNLYLSFSTEAQPFPGQLAEPPKNLLIPRSAQWDDRIFAYMDGHVL